MPGFFGLLAAAALSAGCGGGGDPGDDGDDGADGDSGDSGGSGGSVELGTGTTAFEPVGEESELVLVAGPQGGHHFVVHARISGLDPGDPSQPGLVSNPATRFSVTDEDGARLELEMYPYRLGYELVDGHYVLPSGRIVQVREAAVPSLYGSRAHIEVEVTDAEGQTASDGRWVIAVEALR
jgi:hypothetical protein